MLLKLAKQLDVFEKVFAVNGSVYSFQDIPKFSSSFVHVSFSDCSRCRIVANIDDPVNREFLFLIRGLFTGETFDCLRG